MSEESPQMNSDGVDGIRTTRLLSRAVKQRWPIPEEYKEAIIRRQVKIAIDSSSTPREASSAARTILAADRLNIEEEKPAESQQHLHLHQHNETTIDYSKISLEDLERIEKELIELSAGKRVVEPETGTVQEKSV